MVPTDLLHRNTCCLPACLFDKQDETSQKIKKYDPRNTRWVPTNVPQQEHPKANTRRDIHLHVVRNCRVLLKQPPLRTQEDKAKQHKLFPNFSIKTAFRTSISSDKDIRLQHSVTDPCDKTSWLLRSVWRRTDGHVSKGTTDARRAQSECVRQLVLSEHFLLDYGR